MTFRVGFQLAVAAILGLMASVLAPAAGAQVEWSCDGKAATIVGTVGNDVLRGTPGDDVIVARQGNDIIDGLGGDDIVCAGRGNDEITGGSGFDIIYAAQGDDIIYAANGESVADRSDTRGARMFGGAGNDTIYGSNRWDRMQGGPGRDSMYGFEGRDWMRAGADKDFVDGGEGIDDLHGGNGADTIQMTEGDIVKGGAGVDFCDIAVGEPGSMRSCENDDRVPVVVNPIAPVVPVVPAPAAPGNVEVISCSARNETVQLANSGAAITLNGWTLVDRGPQWTFELDGITIDDNATVLLQFGTKADIPGAIRLSTRDIWNNAGDTATLIGPDGAVVSTLAC